MSDYMVERVARAICANEDNGEPCVCAKGLPVAQMCQNPVRKARAAINAMRNPPEAVIRELGAWGVCAGDTNAAWERALDVALELGDKKETALGTALRVLQAIQDADKRADEFDDPRISREMRAAVDDAIAKLRGV
jgi:hypothetical protein